MFYVAFLVPNAIFIFSLNSFAVFFIFIGTLRTEAQQFPAKTDDDQCLVETCSAI
jgi:hypothetical protein